jgi:hypothetical protein
MIAQHRPRRLIEPDPPTRRRNAGSPPALSLSMGLMA